MKTLFKKTVCLLFALILTLSSIIPKNNVNAATIEKPTNLSRTHTFIVTPEGNLIEIDPSSISTNEERIVLGSYTLTKSQTKDLADMMATLNSPTLTIAEALMGFMSGTAGATLALCLSLSRTSVFKSDVIYAANNNKRIKITITDSKNVHTSYSTQITYTVV